MAAFDSFAILILNVCRRGFSSVVAAPGGARHDCVMTANPDRWPELPFAAWRDTRDTLHLWTQVVGKIRLALTPWLNHSWHVALYVTARGLTTSPMPCQGGSLAIDFDFIDHVLWLRLSDGHFRQVELKPVSVAEFYADVNIALKELGVAVPIRAMPCEIPDCVPFDQDTTHKSYDAGLRQPLLARAARRA